MSFSRVRLSSLLFPFLCGPGASCRNLNTLGCRPIRARSLRLYCLPAFSFSPKLTLSISSEGVWDDLVESEISGCYFCGWTSAAEAPVLLEGLTILRSVFSHQIFRIAETFTQFDVAKFCDWRVGSSGKKLGRPSAHCTLGY